MYASAKVAVAREVQVGEIRTAGAYRQRNCERNVVTRQASSVHSKVRGRFVRAKEAVVQGVVE